MECLSVLTQEVALICEERTSKDKGTLRPMVSLYPGRLELRKGTGGMLELVQEDRGPSIYGEGRIHVRCPQLNQGTWPHNLAMISIIIIIMVQIRDNSKHS